MQRKLNCKPIVTGFIIECTGIPKVTVPSLHSGVTAAAANWSSMTCYGNVHYVMFSLDYNLTDI